MGVVIACTFQKFQSSTREPNTWVINLATQEMEKEQVGDLAAYVGKYVKVYITDENVLQPKIIEAVDETELSDSKKAKTKSQRLRHELWRLWRSGDRAIPFQEFYDETLENVINHYRDMADGKK